ncbi:MAG: aldo/keto reductase, partial [Chloroflexota bacterium]
MQPDKQRPIGNTSVRVTQFGLGGAPFGNVFSTVSDDAVNETIAAAFDAGVRYFDTAPLYGRGRSEQRLGAGLVRFPRNAVVISTKVGYTLVPRTDGDYDTRFDYSRDAVLRSLDESMKRLQTDRVDIVLIHDPDESLSTQPNRDPYERSHFADVMAGAYPALAELRAQGVVKAIGLGMNQWQMLYDFAQAGDFDCFLLAGRYTLLEQTSLQKLLPLCAQKQISVIIGGPYNSGILATGAVDGALYNYLPAPAHIMERVRQIEAVCARHHVALQAAALQFPFGHPAVTSIIPGARSVAELEANLRFCQQRIPADLWAELKRLALLDADAP